MTRPFLSAVGVLYIVLAAWCTITPGTTSRAVGFTLSPGSGQSEYLVVYGGLQLALGLIFLMPLVRADVTGSSLMVCAIVHASVVAFRLISFVCYSGIDRTTYVLAGLEGLILIVALALLFRK